MQILVFSLLCLIWGTTWVAIKISLQGLPPFIGAASRFIVAVTFLLIYAVLKRHSLKIPRSLAKVLIWSAFLMYIFDYGLVYWGEQFVSAGVTAIFFATFPIFTAIFSNFVVRNEPFRRETFAGLLLAFTGVALVFYDQLLLTQFSSRVILAVLAIVIGAAGGALSVVLVKKYLQELHPVVLSLHQMLWGIVGLAGLGMIVGEPQRIHLNREVLLAVLYLGAVGSAFAFAMYYWLLQKSSAITVSLIIYITPIIAILADRLVMKESISPRSVVGMGIIFLGIALTQWPGYRLWREMRMRRTEL